MLTHQEKSLKITKARNYLNSLRDQDVCIYSASVQLRDCVNHAFRGTTNAAFGDKFCELYNPRGFHLTLEATEKFLILEMMIFNERDNIQNFFNLDVI